MKTVIIVQARMTSTRLPGKVLKEVLGKPLLEYQIERLRRVKLADEFVIATTVNETDLPIVRLCEKLNIAYFRGSEEDVLSRYYHCAKESGGEVIVRITSDCPIIDPQVIDKTIHYYTTHRQDYVSNSLERTYPRGMDTEVFSYKCLSEAFHEAVDKPEREHVTPFIYRRPERYRLANVSYMKSCGDYRWTVDTNEDYELIRLMIEELYPGNPNFSLEDALDAVERHPEWRLLNAHVQQKGYGH